MEEFLKGAMLGMLAGVCVGAVIVAKNRKLAGKLKEGLSTAEDKLKEVKEDLQEKFSEDGCDCLSGDSKASDDCKCDEMNSNFGGSQGNKDFSKKSKNL